MHSILCYKQSSTVAKYVNSLKFEYKKGIDTNLLFVLLQSYVVNTLYNKMRIKMSHARGEMEEETYALFKVNYAHPLIFLCSQTAIVMPLHYRKKIAIPQCVGGGYLKTAI